MKLSTIAAALLAGAAATSAIAADQVVVVPVESTEIRTEPVYISNPAPSQRIVIVPQSSLHSSADIRTNQASVLELQQELNLRGYPTAINGVWSPSTTVSLQEFQRANGIIPSGYLNSPTLVALGYTVVPLLHSEGLTEKNPGFNNPGMK